MPSRYIDVAAASKLRGYITYRNEDGTNYIVNVEGAFSSTQNSDEKTFFDAEDAIQIMTGMEVLGKYQVMFHAQLYPKTSTEGN